MLVDVEGEGLTATFTFKGQKVGELPDLPPLETVGAIDDEGETGPIDIPKSAGSDAD